MILYKFKDPKDVKIETLEEYNPKLIKTITLYREQHEEAMITIDDLSKENQRLRDFKAKWEERFDSGN